MQHVQHHLLPAAQGQCRQRADELRELVQPTPEIDQYENTRLRGQFAAYMRAPRFSKADARRQVHDQWKRVYANSHAVLPLSCTLGYWGLRTLAQTVIRDLGPTSWLGVTCGLSLPGQGAAYAGLWIASEAFSALASRLRAPWQQSAYDSYLREMQVQTQGQLADWADEGARHLLSDAVAARGPEAFGSAVNLMDASVGSLGALGNLCWMAKTGFDSSTSCILGTCVVATLVGLGLNNCYVLASYTEDEGESQAAVRRHAASFPDNIQIGNRLNQALWQERQDELTGQYKRATGRRRTNQTVVQWLGTAVVGLPPMLGLTSTLAAPNLSDGQIIKTAKNLNLLVSISVLVKGAADTFLGASTAFKQINSLTESTYADTTKSWNGRMVHMLHNRDQVQVEHNGQEVDIDDLLRDPRRLVKEPGRWSIRARNGVGKTTLASALMTQLAGLYDYIPVKHALYFEYQTGSAGQKAIMNLEETLRASTRPILFVDEGNANLDDKNTARVGEVLDQLAPYKTIVEIIPT